MHAARYYLQLSPIWCAAYSHRGELIHSRQLLKKALRGTEPSAAALRTLAILDATIALHEVYSTWADGFMEADRAPVFRAMRAAEAVHCEEMPRTGLYTYVHRKMGDPPAAGEEEHPPSSTFCPRHHPGASFSRRASVSLYAQGTPGCRGGDCIPGMCDFIRNTLSESLMYDTAIATSLQDCLQEAIEALPAPVEARRVLAILTATIALRRAYQTWKATGEDTPLTREPLELALRAAEAAHDNYTPYTLVYRRICRRLDRAEVPPSEVEPTG